MAYCQTAEGLKNRDDSWGALQLAAHAKRCLLCQLIAIEIDQGGLSPAVIQKNNLRVVQKPKDVWIGLPSRSVVIVNGQELLVKE